MIQRRQFAHLLLAAPIAASGGLSAGIDLALRVVSRYFSDYLAQQTANRMEYMGTGWRA